MSHHIQQIFTSPLKYFEYIYGGLAVVAVDFPLIEYFHILKELNIFLLGNFDEFIKSSFKLEL